MRKLLPSFRTAERHVEGLEARRLLAGDVTAVVSVDPATNLPTLFVTGDEGAFDVWARVGTITWDAKWPATLPPEQKFTVRAEVWSRIAHDTVTI